MRLVKTWASWSRSPRTRPPVAGSVDFERHLALGGDGLERRAALGGDLVERHRLDRADVLAHLDAAERHQVVDQPLHPPGLARHDAEEALAGLGVVAGVMLERLDVADHRGERRPELVAGVGDEVGAELLGAAGLGTVDDLDDGERLAAEGAIRRQHGDAGLEEALAALVGGEAHPALLAVEQRRGHRLDEGRGADDAGEVRAGREARQRRPRRGIGIGNASGLGDDEERRRQLLDQRSCEGRWHPSGRHRARRSGGRGCGRRRRRAPGTAAAPSDPPRARRAVIAKSPRITPPTKASAGGTASAATAAAKAPAASAIIQVAGLRSITGPSSRAAPEAKAVSPAASCTISEL